MQNRQKEIRLALPSKGRLAQDSMSMLSEAGLQVYKPNPRQYLATIPSLPGIEVVFQRVGDIVTSVGDGSVNFGITGWDIFSEKRSGDARYIVLIKELGIGHCTLNVIVPEEFSGINSIGDLVNKQASNNGLLRVATKYPNLTAEFFNARGVKDFKLISADGTLEIAPKIGYADVIVDLISTGTTLRDNRLKILNDGMILKSQACLIANKKSIKKDPLILEAARYLLEYLVAYLRAAENVSVFANIRAGSPEEIARKMSSKSVIGGLQGPTVSKVITQDDGNWFAVHLIVRRDQLTKAITELRAIGGSGVVVSPVMYIFEEEPQAYIDMLESLEN